MDVEKLVGRLKVYADFIQPPSNCDDLKLFADKSILQQKKIWLEFQSIIEYGWRVVYCG